MHPIFLLPLYLLIAVAPLILARLQDLPRRPLLDELSTGLAMVAFAIVLVEFVLSGRFGFVSARIGMDVTMRLHQLLARTALLFALVHPFLYSTPLNPPLPWDTTRQLTLGLGPASLATGLIAWIVLFVLVLMAIFRDQLPYRYETWRLLHGLGAATMAAAITHHTFAAGRYSADPALAAFWAVLLAIALGTLLHTYLVAPLRQLSRPYEVTGVRRLALKTWELTLRPAKGEALQFAAGQFVWLNVGHSPFSLYENPFSISSPPAARPSLQFVIKEAGDMTSRVGEIKPGTRAYLDGPYGNLTLERRAGKGIALIAGGVGIAPLLGIARQLVADDDPRPLMIVYGNRVADQIVYGEELERLAARKDTQVVHVLSQPPSGWRGLIGQLDRETIERAFAFDGARDWLYLLCGPPAMLDAVEEALIRLGIPANRIAAERFYYD